MLIKITLYIDMRESQRDGKREQREAMLQQNRERR